MMSQGRFAWYLFIIKTSDRVLWMFSGGFYISGGTRGPPPPPKKKNLVTSGSTKATKIVSGVPKGPKHKMCYFYTVAV